METQIGQEREKMKKEEERKEARLREELEIALQAKDQQLKEVMSKMSGLKVSSKKTKKIKWSGRLQVHRFRCVPNKKTEWHFFLYWIRFINNKLEVDVASLLLEWI